jgi:hypothetical protein
MCTSSPTKLARVFVPRLWGSPAETSKNYWQNGDIAADHAVDHVTHGLGCPGDGHLPDAVSGTVVADTAAYRLQNINIRNHAPSSMIE